MITIHNDGCMGRAYSRLFLMENSEGSLELQIEGQDNDLSITVEITPLQAAKLAQALRVWADETEGEAPPPSDFEGSL